jgi:hypothetical protein
MIALIIVGIVLFIFLVVAKICVLVPELFPILLLGSIMGLHAMYEDTK